jgi:hypothetical protein
MPAVDLNLFSISEYDLVFAKVATAELTILFYKLHTNISFKNSDKKSAS